MRQKMYSGYLFTVWLMSSEGQGLPWSRSYWRIKQMTIVTNGKTAAVIAKYLASHEITVAEVAAPLTVSVMQLVCP